MRSCRFRFSLATMFALMLVAAIATQLSLWAYREWYIGRQPIPWEPFTSTAVDEARGEGKIALLHVSADWDLGSAYMRHAMETRNLRLSLHRHDVRPILADATYSKSDSEIWQFVHPLAPRGTVPLTIIYPADKNRPPIVLLPLGGEDQMLQAIEAAYSGNAVALVPTATGERIGYSP